MKRNNTDELYQSIISLAHTGRFQEAIALGSHVIENPELYKTSESTINISYSIAMCNYQIGNISEAFNIIVLFEKQCSELNSISNYMSFKNALFLFYHYVGKRDLAITSLIECLELSKQVETNSLTVTVHNNLCHCYIEEGRFKEGLELAKNALQYHTDIELKGKMTYIIILINFSMAFIGMNEFEKAKEKLDLAFLDENLDLFEREKALLYKTLAIWHKKQCQYEESLQAIQYAFDSLKTQKQTHIEKELYSIQIVIYEKLSNWEQAFIAQKSYMQAIQEMDIFHVSYQLAQLEMKNQISEMKDKAYRDPLTGVYNRQYLIGTAEQWFKERQEEDIYCCIFDIDQFKRINDTYGHLVGDKAIQAIAKTINDLSCEGVNQFVTRYGGDEFVLMLRHRMKEEVKYIIRMIAYGIVSVKIKHEGKVIRVTPSIGICSSRDCGAYSFEELFKYADRAMYSIKESGGNNFLFAGREEEKELV